jgi:hypothetical protein
MARARVVHENAPHHSSRDRQEVRAVAPRHIFGIDEPQQASLTGAVA